MNIEEIREYALSLPQTSESFPFDDVSLVFKVAGKMFMLLPLDAEEKSISVKCDPHLAEEFREKYAAVEGAYHFNKKYWNTIYLERDMDEQQIKEWIRHSYDEVVRKLPRSVRESLAE